MKGRYKFTKESQGAADKGGCLKLTYRSVQKPEDTNEREVSFRLVRGREQPAEPQKWLEEVQ